MASKKFKRLSPKEVEDIGLVANESVDGGDEGSPRDGTAERRAVFQPRAASAMEKDLFHFHSLSVELHIEGFIKGLEAAGLDRKALTREAETAVNNLLHILQTLAGDRRRVHADECNRSDLRRLGRHIDDTSLMVNEYVRAVAEECLEPRRLSRYISSHGREQTERNASTPPK